jgi:hypothetical protein
MTKISGRRRRFLLVAEEGVRLQIAREAPAT